MTYKDPETRKEYPKGPFDFIDEGNTRYVPRPDSETGTELNPDFDQKKYDREHKAWEDYKKKYDEQDGEDQRSPEAARYDVPQAPEFDAKKESLKKSTFVPPPVPGGGDGKGDRTVVNTVAMKRFGDNVAKLVDPMKNSLKLVEDISLAPGGLGESWELRNKIMGSGGDSGGKGLVPELRKSIFEIKQALDAVRNAAIALAKKYDSVEELNKLDAKKMGPHLYQANTYIGGLGSGQK
ncbi:hypothetical protein [Saccharothrix australiensis]|uniref:Uncharacterized protein n=1 Tax=Saccharothrix australiensis TaxID=2072 RepID=A0A495W7G0_9PSEU|nr:hypothetical protein [Saccharothrix australiensis]RKT56745.1 hypothetical protein C8E97_5455 [Saccharothrix australiensis]